MPRRWPGRPDTWSGPVSNPSPKTARELVALVESLLSGMSPQERWQFVELITTHADNQSFREGTAYILKEVGAMLDERASMIEQLFEYLDTSIAKTDRLDALLKKHRKPRTNAER